MPGQGRQPQNHAGGVTSRVGDHPRPGHRFPIQLGEAVHSFGHQLGIRVAEAVPLLISGEISQAEIGTQINDLHSTRNQLSHHRMGFSVGIANECHIRPVHHFRTVLHVRAFRAQVREHVANRLPAVRHGGEGANVDVGMPPKQVRQDHARVSRGSNDACSDHASTSFTVRALPVERIIIHRHASSSSRSRLGQAPTPHPPPLGRRIGGGLVSQPGFSPVAAHPAAAVDLREGLLAGR